MDAIPAQETCARAAQETKREEPHRCENCGTQLRGNFCSHCGQKRRSLHDLTIGHAWHEFVHETIHVDGRVFTTLKLLFTRPGQLTLDYLEGRRARHLHPLRLFLVLFFFFYFFAQVNPLLNIGQAMERQLPPDVKAQYERRAAAKGTNSAAIFASVTERTAAMAKPLNVVNVVVGGLMLWVSFRRKRPLLAANLVMALHLASFAMTLWLLLGWIDRQGVVWISQYGIPVLYLGYSLIAARKVYADGWGWTITKVLGVEIVKALVAAISFMFVFLRATASALS